MTKRLAITALALLVSTVALAADLPPAKWWHNPQVIQQLGLSTEQQERLEGIFRSSANDLIDLRGDVEKSTIALRGELDKPQLDREAIRRTAARLNTARGRLFERELMMLTDMRGVLSVEQWNRMRAFLDRVERPMQQRPKLRQ